MMEGAEQFCPLFTVKSRISTVKGCTKMEKLFFDNKVRNRIFMGFDWSFALTYSEDFPGEDVTWRSVQIPHDWSVDYPVCEDAPSCGSGGYARTGIGWYRKQFEFEKTDKTGRTDRISLQFEGVYMNCTVWVNHECASAHIYGYTPFEIDVTDRLELGTNEILVRVNNSHQPGSRWYTGSGITRDVYVLRTDRNHIEAETTQIKTGISNDYQQAKLEIRSVVHIDINTKLGSSRADAITDAGEKTVYSLVNTVLDTENKEIASVIESIDESTFVLADLKLLNSLEISKPRIWSIENPYIYTLRQDLVCGDAVVDSVTTSFGVRRTEFDCNKGFLLNGKKTVLKGVCIHHDGGCVGAAVPPGIWERRLGKLKKMGANALRLSHNPSDPVILKLADEMGFVVVAEAFDEWEIMKYKKFGSNTHESRGYSEWFTGVWRDDLTSFIVRDRNHPSVIMWSIGNEIIEQVTEDGAGVAARLAGLVHSLDETRPVTAACDQEKAEPYSATEAFLNQLDVVGVNYVDRWRDRTVTCFDEEKREHPQWKLFGSEDTAVGGRRNDGYMTVEKNAWFETTKLSRLLKVERLWKYIMSHSFVMGSFMWTGIDYLGECFWPEKSASAGVMDTCGFEKDGYFFYKSIWTKLEEEPVLHVSMNCEKGSDSSTGGSHPVIVFTNCFTVELFVGGVSYGTKAYEYPPQGMTKGWAHFDRPICPITTDDLHLTWDVPFGCGEVTAIGRDISGKEIVRETIAPAGEATEIKLSAGKGRVLADGRSVIQIEISLCDKEGRLVTGADKDIRVTVSNGELLGMDNGDPDCHLMYREGHRPTYGGLAYAVARAPKYAGTIKVAASADGLPYATFEAECYNCGES